MKQSVDLGSMSERRSGALAEQQVSYKPTPDEPHVSIEPHPPEARFLPIHAVTGDP
ncbi:MAG: hypothetical protein ACJ786_11630 [Catenulispora sp.]